MLMASIKGDIQRQQIMKKDTGGDKNKVLILVVCYNAERTIETVLDRIPKDIWQSKSFCTEILIIDDQSSDRTFYAAEDYARRHPEQKLTVLCNPKSQGYGGNQKIGYCYAIKKGFNIIVLLHGDGRYAPEYLGQMLQPILDGEADAVFGSRVIHRLDALKRRMPFYKWVGNQVLTLLQNRIMQSHLSEFHSGYRAYSVAALVSIPFENNSDYFDFDTDIIIQLLDTQKRIKEISVPAFYSNDIAGARGIKYAMRVIHACLLSKIMRLGIYYHPKFDYEPASNYHYKEKFGYLSSHQFAFDQVRPGATVVDIGCGPGFMAAHLAAKNGKTVSIDIQIRPQTRKNSWKCIEANVEQYDFDDDFGKVDYILALDIIEHLKSPERLFRILRERFSRDAPQLIITTGNVAFFPLRIGLLFDSFHYGIRGVLDMDHTRLFTFSSLCRTVKINGYEIIKKRGMPAPFPLALGDGWLARFLLLINRVLIFFSKSLFSYQVAIIAKPLPTLEPLLEDAHEAKKKKLSDSAWLGGA
jgi:glycosyltransferase involved in cell wall biosynthesis